MDAISFVLCVQTKNLRGKNLGDLTHRDDEEEEALVVGGMKRGCDWECEAFVERLRERRGPKRELSDGFTNITGSLSRRLPIDATHTVSVSVSLSF